MTQQFKFGDRVRDEQGNEFIVIREEGAYCEVINERGKKSDFKGHQLTLAHTDDTARLDWLIKRNFDFQKCYDMGGRWWYEDNSFDEIEGTEGMTEREAIDKVMEKEMA